MVWAATVICLSMSAGAGGSTRDPAPRWRADHHLHLASPDLCGRVGDCLDSHDPAAVFASDAIRALDAAQVDKGVVLSCAYLYGLPSLHLTPDQIATWVRRENEFTAAQVAKYPDRLVGFLSVDPLQPSAIQEIEHWKGRGELIGLKLHFSASAVHLRKASEREQVARVIAVAAAQHLPMVIHLGGGDFDAQDAETFIRSVLPSAGSSWIQIAHAAGGLPLKGDNHVAVLQVFADHIARNDPVTAQVLFDVSYVPAPEETQAAVDSLLRQIRRIGISKFLFGSDFNVLDPAQEIAYLRRLRLTRSEMSTLQGHCAPWAC